MNAPPIHKTLSPHRVSADIVDAARKRLRIMSDAVGRRLDGELVAVGAIEATDTTQVLQLLRTLRHMSGLRLVDVGREAGLSAGYISRLETGRRALHPETASRLLAIMNKHG